MLFGYSKRNIIYQKDSPIKCASEVAVQLSTMLADHVASFLAITVNVD